LETLKDKRIDLKTTNILIKTPDLEDLVFNSVEMVSEMICPTWDTRDFVAVNPFWGFRDRPYLDAIRYVQKGTGESLLPDFTYYKEKYLAGKITHEDLAAAIENIHMEYQDEFLSVDEDYLVKKLDASEKKLLHYKCLSDLFDEQSSLNSTNEITNEVSRWVAAYMDEGIAQWKMPHREKGLFHAWKLLAEHSTPFKTKKVAMHELLNKLPHNPNSAIMYLMVLIFQRVTLNQDGLTNYLFRLLSTVSGWASLIKKKEFELSRDPNKADEKVETSISDILAIRLFYDVLFLSDLNDPASLVDSLEDEDIRNKEVHLIQMKYIWQLALENSYRQEVIGQMSLSRKTIVKETRPKAQMAFCIDVRSEVIRRNIERMYPDIQTIGFAGFFGIPFSHRDLGNDQGDQQCPVLLEPAMDLVSRPVGFSEKVLLKKRQDFVNNHHFLEKIKSSNVSGFTFVESQGLGYLYKMLVAATGKESPNVDFKLGLSVEEKQSLRPNIHQLTISQQTEIAFGALKNMGLTKSFARSVIFFGHGSESANNPYASGLDCGACAGHNGHSNARVLCDLLNSRTVRKELRHKGINIPGDTLFVAGWHNTTTDKLNVDIPNELSSSRVNELKMLEEMLAESSRQNQRERSQYFPDIDENLAQEFSKKAYSWSELRPEWGLARNASFIVADRSLTKNMNLDGRAFLHEYDEAADNDLSRLELIMTAPMIVTNWINMQYYASTVSNKKFGSGNKTLHNVVAGIGCISGTDGDLLTGLSEQSVSYGGKNFHEPIRLQVFINASKSSIDTIINKHQLVKDLVENNWLSLICIDQTDASFWLYQKYSWKKL
jgi:uncharacterized protein YbcC (UPF0753/DUF2309 family)